MLDDEDVMELDDDEVLDVVEEEEVVADVGCKTVAILCTAERNPGRLGAVDCAAAALLDAAKARPANTDSCQCILLDNSSHYPD